MRFVVKPNPEAPSPKGYHHYPLVVWDNEAQRIAGRYNTNALAEEYAEYCNWYHLLPVGERTGDLLKKVRALLSTAERAVTDWWGSRADKEELAMHQDLQQVTAILRKWERTGKTPERK